MTSATARGVLAVSAVVFGACSSGSTAETKSEDAGPPRDAARHDAVDDAKPAFDVYVAPRPEGQRAPLSAPCETVDGTRCLLPWPSNTYTVVDEGTKTGLRVALSATGIGATDDAVSVNRADGFSRVSPILTGWDGTLDPSSFGDEDTGVVRVIVEQPGPDFGHVVPVRYATETTDGAGPAGGQSVIIAYPRVPLAPGTDYAVVVTNGLKFTDGTAAKSNRNDEVALGLSAPETKAEAALFAYDAPARAAMKAAGLEPSQTLRVWDFTTRSLTDPTTELTSMRTTEIAAFDTATDQARDAGADASVSLDGGTHVGIVIDTVTTATTGTVAIVVEGRIQGVPSYLKSNGSLNRSSDGAPLAHGVHDVPFRAAIPTGTGPYRLVMYGHGTGGNYHDPAFDQEITANGAMKVGIQFIGWTDTSIIDTFELFAAILKGTEISSAGLLQSLADGMVVEHALGSVLGTVLGAETIEGIANPAAGRQPNLEQPVWAGGSLGGTMGFVYSAAEPAIDAAILNVPGAAWSHFVTGSTLFSLVKAVMRPHYETDVDVFLAVATSQLNFDPVDGANWYDAVGDHHPLLLEQESMGDPVLPNIGNEMVAAASHAEQVGVVLNPIATCVDVAVAKGHTGMTQFKVPKSVTAALDIHGFAAGSSVAGVAAQQQIQSFIGSVWAGDPTIGVPPKCATNQPKNSCDFTND